MTGATLLHSFNILYGSKLVEAVMFRLLVLLLRCFNILYGSKLVEAQIYLGLDNRPPSFNILYGSKLVEARVRSCVAILGSRFQYPLRIEVS